jgi:ribosome maturation factor RimP
MTCDAAIKAVVADIAERLGLTVYDVEQVAGTLRVLLDRPGGIDLDTLTEANRLVSRAIDADPALGTPTTLEVSSPGLERRLRTPAHFVGAIGERVRIRTKPHVEGDRRADGILTAADGSTVTVSTDTGTTRTIHIDDIDKATTEFRWGPAPKPGGRTRPGRAARRAPEATDHSEATR